ncbi:hypothetical protein BDP27DRAFT_17884 [Rhodocollybia butyracea]|uniref:Uncharacterized protein n=1 Tax=Rhodocollybia butyracea TaxID=206335 RepID=A0A9P5QB19_9AGAR|nr:hypothetical protein BDP27DRAFT_17884 [Rhodocollybia butyracea]
MPTLPEISESEISSESSSPLSTPMLSSSSTSGPYPGSSGPSSSPTPPPSTTTSSSVSPGSPTTTASTIRPPPLNPSPLLTEIRDQVRALGEGQLATNDLLRGLQGEPQDEVLPRIRRIEDMLQGLLNREMPEPAAPVEPEVPRSATPSSWSSEDIFVPTNLGPPHIPIAQHPDSGISLARRLAEILSQDVHPTPRRPVPPNPLQPFDYAPLPRGQGDSPLGSVRIPPLPSNNRSETRSAPPLRRPRQQPRGAPGQFTQPFAPAEPSGPSGPSSEAPGYRMGDIGRQAQTPRRQHNFGPLPQPVFPRAQTVPPPDNLGGDGERDLQSWYRRVCIQLSDSSMLFI